MAIRIFHILHSHKYLTGHILPNFFNRLSSVNGVQNVSLSIVLKNRSSNVSIISHSLCNNFRGIILSLDQWFTCEIILTSSSGRIVFQMVSSTTTLMDSSSTQSINEDLLLDIEIEDGVNFLIPFFEHFVQLLGLVHSSWETIENDSLLTFGGLNFCLDNINDQVIRDQISLLHNGLGLNTQSCTISDLLSEQITSGNMATAEFVFQFCGLGTLSGTWRTEQDDSLFGVLLTL
mmetsp:Transcript_9076/g.7995  ORF Transcript_9076/g.7995 Transcript_9076/m.7995 type:complete len:233 (-) Transcript_9076:134-832(-)